jgi:hypothetical protein
LKQIFNYCLKVWLTALVVGPVLWLLFGLVLTTRVEFSSSSPVIFLGRFLAYMAYMIILGSIVSIPSFIILYLSAFLLAKWICSIQVFKYLLSFLGVLYSFIPILVSASSAANLSTTDLLMFSSYPIMILAGIWYFKFNIALAVKHTKNTN